jgi:hypothetical protein
MNILAVFNSSDLLKNYLVVVAVSLEQIVLLWPAPGRQLDWNDTVAGVWAVVLNAVFF